jgi:oxygen-independent coproporphyrinogen-3 oxidase
LAEAGYHRYEISNWSRPQRASRHNVLYWSAGDYLGFGAGAHGHSGGRRFWSLRRPRDFIAAVEGGASTVEGEETLSPYDRAGEALILGLRLSSGVNVDGFSRRFGAGFRARSATIEELENAGLVRRFGGWIRLSEAATLVANEVLCRLV